MARSKVGGAWGFLRGSIGSVTYSTRKNSAGKKQQIARSKASEVTNPNSTAQIMQRMKLGPAQRFYDAYENVVGKGIISHSFEHIPYGSASRQHFLSLAMKEEAAVYVPKGVDFFVPGEYVVSEGSIPTIGYDTQVTAEEAQQKTLLVDFNDTELTADNVSDFVALGYEQGMQVTLIGARAAAAGRYEPFATRILMNAGNTAENAVDVNLFNDGSIYVGDETIAAVAIIISKGSNEGNDHRSTQKMKFVNGFESLKSLDALQAAIDSYAEGYEVNSLNSNWYLNQDSGQAFNGRVEILTTPIYNADPEIDDTHAVFAGIKVNGDQLSYVIFTDDGTENGKVFATSSVRPNLLVNFGYNVEGENVQVTGAMVNVSPKTYVKLTPEIAAQGGFTTGAA